MSKYSEFAGIRNVVFIIGSCESDVLECGARGKSCDQHMSVSLLLAY